MAEQAIFTVLVMVSDGSGNLLMEDRNDPSWPGICFPGGHVEPGEAFTAAAIRETREDHREPDAVRGQAVPSQGEHPVCGLFLQG